MYLPYRFPKWWICLGRFAMGPWVDQIQTSRKSRAKPRINAPTSSSPSRIQCRHRTRCTRRNPAILSQRGTQNMATRGSLAAKWTQRRKTHIICDSTENWIPKSPIIIFPYLKVLFWVSPIFRHTHNVRLTANQSSSAVVSKFTNAIQNQINNLLANRIVPACKIVGCVLFSGDQLFWMKELTVSASAPPHQRLWAPGGRASILFRNAQFRHVLDVLKKCGTPGRK